MQRMARKLERDVRIVQRREGRQTSQASFEFPNIGRDILRDVEPNVGGEAQAIERRLLLDDRNAGLQIGWRDIRNEARLESIAQPILQSRNVFRHFVRGQHDLMALAMERVEGMEKLLLSAVAAREE